MPFGLEALPLALMAWGTRMLLDVASFVASLPGAQVRAPAIAPACLLLIAAGMLWLCLWRRRWRLLGLAPIGMGAVLIPLLIAPPDILVAPGGNAVAVRDGEGTRRVSGARAGSYTVDQFFDEEGGAPSDGDLLRKGVTCDASACILRDRAGQLVSHVRDATAFAEDCTKAVVIVTRLAAPPECAAALIIDTTKLAATGAQAIWISGKGEGDPDFEVATYRSATPRPWQAGANPAGSSP
jgi:competence protein ComEC